MKTSICQPQLERGNHLWQSGMRSANWVRAVRGRFYSSPRTDLWVFILSAGSSRTVCKIIGTNDVQEQALTATCFDACTLWQIHGSTSWRFPHCSAGIDGHAGWLGSRSFWWRAWNIQNEPKHIPGSSCPAQVDSFRCFAVLLTSKQLSWNAPGESHGGRSQHTANCIWS